MRHSNAVIGLVIGHFLAIGFFQQLYAGINHCCTRESDGVVAARSLTGCAIGGNGDGDVIFLRAFVLVGGNGHSGRIAVVQLTSNGVSCGKGIAGFCRGGIALVCFAGLVVMRNGYDIKITFRVSVRIIAPRHAFAREVHDINGGNVCEVISTRLTRGAVHTQTARAHEHNGIRAAIF